MTTRLAAQPWFVPVPPPPALSRVLACSWTATPSGQHRLVPDACIDVLWLSSGHVWLCGPEDAAWTFQLPPGTVAAGVRFRPGAAPAVLGLDAATVRNRRIPWRDVVGVQAEDRLLRRLSAAGTGAEQVAALEGEVAALLHHEGVPCRFAEGVLTAIARTPRVRTAQLAAGIGLTPRQLHRRCLTAFGYGASTLGRIVRFHRFWSIASLSPASTPLSALAHQAGYADQAHLVRDCRAITGSPPRRFLAESFATFPDMSDPFKTGQRFAARLSA